MLREDHSAADTPCALLHRDEALAHPWINEVFHITDHMRSFRSFLSRGSNVPISQGCVVTGSPKCPICSSEFTYVDNEMYACPECAHEWSIRASADEPEQKRVFRDANGNELHDGDSVTVIKDLKVKGSSAVVKVGTKVKGIRLVDGDHDVDCKIEGIGPMQLKSEFVRKA